MVVNLEAKVTDGNFGRDVVRTMAVNARVNVSHLSPKIISK